MHLPLALEFQVPAVARNTEKTSMKVPLVIPPGRDDVNNLRDRKAGILLTIQQAALGENRTMPISAFDDVLEHGRIINMTAFQNHKGSQCLNGNMYCVLVAEGKGNLPSSISVKHPTTCRVVQFYTRYRGQEWYCRRCDEMHVGGSPVAKEFFRLQQKRENEVRKTKMTSDFTLKHAHHLDLKADVIVMSVMSRSSGREKRYRRTL